jgi:hypothetical protein
MKNVLANSPYPTAEGSLTAAVEKIGSSSSAVLVFQF